MICIKNLERKLNCHLWHKSWCSLSTLNFYSLPKGVPAIGGMYSVHCQQDSTQIRCQWQPFYPISPKVFSTHTSNPHRAPLPYTSKPCAGASPHFCTGSWGCATSCQPSWVPPGALACLQGGSPAPLCSGHSSDQHFAAINVCIQLF